MKTQYIKIDEEGNKYYFSDAAMKTLHRTDGPAIEYASGSKKWWINGELHRTDGPAVELANGYGTWWLDGKRHRVDGPAIEWAGGYKAWFVDDEELTEEQFNARFAAVELTLEDIADKFGVDVNNLKIIK